MVLSPWEGLGWRACQWWPPHSPALAISPNDVCQGMCHENGANYPHNPHTGGAYHQGERRLSQTLTRQAAKEVCTG